MFSVSSEVIFCTSSSSKGIGDILSPSTLYEVNELESTIIFPISVSLTAIAELGSCWALVNILLINSLSTILSDANFKRLLNGILSTSG